MRAGSGSGRGRHRNRGSAETRKWEQIANADWLQVAKTTPTLSPKPEPPAKPARNGAVTKPPPCPPWMDADTFDELLEMRRRLWRLK